MKWTDETSYSKGERGNVDPRTWQLKCKTLRIEVHRLRHLEGWFLSVRELTIGAHDLKANDLEIAKINAIAFIAKTIADMSNDFTKAIGVHQ